MPSISQTFKLQASSAAFYEFSTSWMLGSPRSQASKWRFYLEIVDTPCVPWGTGWEYQAICDRAACCHDQPRECRIEG
jgi:hypothetical protein